MRKGLVQDVDVLSCWTESAGTRSGAEASSRNSSSQCLQGSGTEKCTRSTFTRSKVPYLSVPAAFLIE